MGRVVIDAGPTRHARARLGRRGTPTLYDRCMFSRPALKRPAAIAAACLSLTVLAACGDDETSADAGDTVTCEYPASVEAVREVDAPPVDAPSKGEVKLMIATSQGDIPITLDRAAAPCTVNSFVSLAEQGFYDDSPCPRLGNMPNFGILQCGDPSGTGSGGPGYSFADELTGDETYPGGTLAMANSGPDTNASQFFFVFADSLFPPNYTVFGTIDEDGVEVLTTVAEGGDDGSNPSGGGVPNTPVQIETVTVS